MSKLSRRLREAQTAFRERHKRGFSRWLYSNYADQGFSFISENCVGQRFYKELRQKYLSPTVGLFFGTADFLSFCEHLDANLRAELREDRQAGVPYPVGLLGRVRVHFLHSTEFSSAAEAWHRRARRVDPSRIVVLTTNLDCTDDALISRFIKLPFRRKLAFSRVPYRGSAPVVYVRGSEHPASRWDLYSNFGVLNAGPVRAAIRRALGPAAGGGPAIAGGASVGAQA
ncbi:MAG: DUF1919 domain-containing protein [Bauldia sp.]